MILKEKVIIVTGAARGIGKVYAKGIAEAGGKVVVADILDGDSTLEEVRQAGGEALCVYTDVSDEQSVQALAETANNHFGRVDGLVNNAAMFAGMTYHPFDQITVEEWDRVMAVNVKGPWLAARAVYPFMKARGAGKIINIASGAPFKGIPLFSHYSVSKGAVVALTRVLARSMGKDGICVNTVAPGFTHTDILIATREDLEAVDVAEVASRAIPRTEYPEDLAGAIVFFLSSGADFITGQTLLVDGGSYML